MYRNHGLRTFIYNDLIFMGAGQEAYANHSSNIIHTLSVPIFTLLLITLHTFHAMLTNIQFTHGTVTCISHTQCQSNHAYTFISSMWTLYIYLWMWSVIFPAEEYIPSGAPLPVPTSIPVWSNSAPGLDFCWRLHPPSDIITISADESCKWLAPSTVIPRLV